MPRLNWKSLLLLTAVAVAGSAILISGIVSTIRLPLFGWGGIAPLVALVALTVVSSRFIVPVTSVVMVAEIKVPLAAVVAMVTASPAGAACTEFAETAPAMSVVVNETPRLVKNRRSFSSARDTRL